VANFIKHFFRIIYPAIGVLPYVLAEVMPIGVYIMPKKVYEIETWMIQPHQAPRVFHQVKSQRLHKPLE
jgi:hypothetical protein